MPGLAQKALGAELIDERREDGEHVDAHDLQAYGTMIYHLTEPHRWARSLAEGVHTGSSRGIGLGIAQGFARAGARLLLIADDPKVVDRARDLGGAGAVADITDGKAVAAALAATPAIDVLINNAGLELLTPVTEADAETEAKFRRIVEIKRKKKADLTDDDYAHMKKVVAYVRRHTAQGGPAKDKEHSDWRYSLMNWGHDPMKE